MEFFYHYIDIATIHGVSFDANLNFIFDPAMILLSGVAGYMIGVVRNSSESIIPGFVLHNCINLMAFTVPWLVQVILN